MVFERKSGDYMMLPASVQEIADVIGRDEALHLISRLPTCYAGGKGKQSTRVILYVPKKLKPNHRLVQILGWDRANQLVEGFGGEILQPANCAGVYKEQRDKEIRRLASEEGKRPAELAAMFKLSERQIRNLTRSVPKPLPKPAND